MQKANNTMLRKSILLLIFAISIAFTIFSATLFYSGFSEHILDKHITYAHDNIGLSKGRTDKVTPTEVSFRGSAEIYFTLDSDKELEIKYLPDSIDDCNGMEVIINDYWIYTKLFRPSESKTDAYSIPFCGVRGQNKIRLIAINENDTPNIKQVNGGIHLRFITLESQDQNDILPFSTASYINRCIIEANSLLHKTMQTDNISNFIHNPLNALCLIFISLLAFDIITQRTKQADKHQRVLTIVSIASQAVFFALAGLIIMNYIWTLYHTFTSQTDQNIIEGRELLKGALFPKIEQMYTFADSYNYLITLYPPAYFAITKFFISVFGKSLLATRACSLTMYAILITATSIFVYHKTKNKVIVASLAIILLCNQTIVEWSPLGRPDITAWSFLFLAIFTFEYGVSKNKMYFLLSSTMSLAAILTKQQTLPFILGISFYGLVHKDSRINTAILYTTPLVLLFSFIFAYLCITSGGSFFFDTLKYPVMLNQSLDFNSITWLVKRLTGFFDNQFSLIFIFCILSLYELTRNKISIFTSIFVINIPFYINLMKSWGADSNYSLGIIITASIASVLSCTTLTKIPRRQTLICMAFICIILSSAHPGNGFTFSTLGNAIQLSAPPSQDDFSHFKHSTNALIDKSHGPALVDAESYFIVSNLKHEMHFFDSMEMYSFNKAKLWCSQCSSIIKDIKNKVFSNILLRDDIDSIIIETVKSNYHAVENCQKHTLYAPNT